MHSLREFTDAILQYDVDWKETCTHWKPLKYFHCNNVIEESFRFGMFHSFIRLLLVEVEQLYILWYPVPRIFINNYGTPITSSIKNSVRKKVVFYRRR